MPDQQHPSSSDRRLAAIMFTDIVGYTTLMQKDEQNALHTIERHRYILEKFTAKYHGTVLQYYGDGSLSIFPSTFDAVECALEIQKELIKEPTVPLRIGIHLGDVIIKGESVFGDGVNMASRLESLGIAGSILISDTIYHLVRNQPDIKTTHLGKFTLKNIDHPVPVYALTNEYLSVPKSVEIPGRIKPFPGKSTWLVLTVILIVLVLGGYSLSRIIFSEKESIGRDDKSIAVLPFNNLSNDPQQEYFSDGITDDIINHLAKISALRVKSRTTTEQYKGPDKTIPKIGRELGVSYILEGSVRKVGNKVRIVAQLIDVQNDFHLWSETFDREITEIFEIQSEIAIEIAQVLETTLSNEERRHIRGGRDGKRRSTDITAYDYMLRARDIWRNWNDEKDLENALQLLEQAIQLDPDFANGYVMIGNILHYGMRNYGVPIQLWIDQALHMAEIAIWLDSTLSSAYLLRGDIYSNQPGKKDEELFQKAISLAPGWTVPYYNLGQLYRYQNDFDMAEKTFSKALEISPLDQDIIDALAWTYLMNGKTEDAARYWSMYEELEQQFTDPSQYVPYRHRLGYVKHIQGDKTTSISLIKEQLQLDLERQQGFRGYGAWVKGGYYYDLATTNAFLGNREEALAWLDSAYQKGFINLWYMKNDPLLTNIRKDPDFQRIRADLSSKRQKEIRAFKKALKENKEILPV